MKVLTVVGRNAQKHAQACTDALVASHHQPRNLNIVRAKTGLLEAQVVPTDTETVFG